MNAPTNFPPPDADPLRDRLSMDYGTQVERAKALIEAAAAVPDPTDDDMAGALGDQAVQIAAHIKLMGTTHSSEKEPYLRNGRTVDNFFFPWCGDKTGKLVLAVNKLRARATVYASAKAARLKREAEEAARIQREEAARLAAEAAARDAEARRLAAEAEARAAETRASASLASQAAAETRASADLMDQAVAVEAEAAKAEQVVAVSKPAAFGKTRGDLGSLTTINTQWTFADLRRDALDLEPLRQHLPAEALEKAVRAFVKAGGRELRGVRIYEAENVSFR